MSAGSPKQSFNQQELLIALGRISFSFSFLEESLINCIGVLMGNETSEVITAGLPFSRLLKLLRALYVQKYTIETRGELPKNLTEVLNRADVANQKRNAIIHSYWHIYPETGIQRIKRQLNNKGLNINIQEINVNDIISIAKEIDYAVQSMNQFLLTLIGKFIPQQVCPADSAIFNQNQIALEWSEVNTAIGYELQIATDTSFTQLVISATGHEMIRESTYKNKVQFPPNTEYYWRVRAVMPDRVSYWSEIRSFKVV